jgi:hypothetical protein
MIQHGTLKVTFLFICKEKDQQSGHFTGFLYNTRNLELSYDTKKMTVYLQYN